MFTRVHGIYGTIGVMLFLVALYLVLEHGGQASSIIGAIGQNSSGVLKTLQGR
jgi:hypothetical protein